MPRGRPRTADQRDRRKTFVRLVLAGHPWKDAAQKARVHGETALGILDDLRASRLVDLDAEEQAA